MRKIIQFIFLCCFVFSAKAQLQAGFNYSMAVPQKEMANNINLTHSIVTDIRYQFKGAAKNFWVGSQFGFGLYAMKTQKEVYQFGNGETTEANVRFTSNIFNTHLIVGADLLSNTAFIPYVTAKGGLSKFYSKVYIPDPSDGGSCKPLENKNVYKDANWSAGFGAGVKIAGNKIVKELHRNDFWLDFSVNYLTGGSVNYLNAKHVMDDNNTNTGSKSYNVTFVHITTNEIHQHKVAEIFTSRIDQLDIKLGLFVKLR